MAHVEKRSYTTKDGKQTLHWRARYRDPRGQERVKTFTRRVDAERFLVGIEHAKLKGEWTEPRLGKIRFDEYAADWLTTKADVGLQTLTKRPGPAPQAHRPHLRRFEHGGRPTGRRPPVRGQPPRGGTGAIHGQEHLPHRQPGLRPGGHRRPHQPLPLHRDRLPEERQREQMHVLTPDQVVVLAEAITPQYSALVYAAAYTGMRAGELAALRLPRLNLLAGTVDVTESMMEVGGQLITGPTKTGRPRTLTLPRFLAEMLGEHIGRYPSPEKFVFTMAEGGPIRQRNFYRRHFKPAVLEAGLPEGLTSTASAIAAPPS